MYLCGGIQSRSHALYSILSLVSSHETEVLSFKHYDTQYSWDEMVANGNTTVIPMLSLMTYDATRVTCHFTTALLCFLHILDTQKCISSLDCQNKYKSDEQGQLKHIINKNVAATSL